MNTKRVLSDIVSGKVDLNDVRRSSNLVVYGFDEKTRVGYLGFNDGKILQVDREKMELFVRLAEVTKEGPLIMIGEGCYCGTLETIKSVLSLVL
jgi:hypothetical protein